MNRKLAFLAGITTTLVVLGGCQKHVGGQVIAVVNGEEITQQQFNSEPHGAATPDKKAALAQGLQQLVERKLLVQKAKVEGIEKTPEYLARVMQMQDQLAVDMLVANQAKKIAVPEKNDVTQFIASNPVMFGARKRYARDEIVFSGTPDAKTRQELTNAHTLDAVAGVLTAHGIPFKRRNGEMDSLVVPKEVIDRIKALPPGEPFIIPDRGQLVASVITSVTASPTPEAEATPIAMDRLRQRALSAAMRAQLAAAKSSATIEYAPGFAPPSH